MLVADVRTLPPQEGALGRQGGAARPLATPSRETGRVKVLLRNPRREIEVEGPVRVHALLARLELNRESVLVIRNDELVPADALLEDADVVEIRPVISGGAT